VHRENVFTLMFCHPADNAVAATPAPADNAVAAPAVTAAPADNAVAAPAVTAAPTDNAVAAPAVTATAAPATSGVAITAAPAVTATAAPATSGVAITAAPRKRKMDGASVTDQIARMDIEGLQRVIDAVKMRRTVIAKKNARGLSIGDSVSFKGKKGQTVRGTVTKVNSKTVDVDVGAHRKWRITATLLTLLAA
jgi:hypothetical protein